MNKLQQWAATCKAFLKTFVMVNKTSTAHFDDEIDDFDHRPYYELVTDRLETEKR